MPSSAIPQGTARADSGKEQFFNCFKWYKGKDTQHMLQSVCYQGALLTLVRSKSLLQFLYQTDLTHISSAHQIFSWPQTQTLWWFVESI